MIDYIIISAALFVVIVFLAAVLSMRNKAIKPPPSQIKTRRPLRRW